MHKTKILIIFIVICLIALGVYFGIKRYNDIKTSMTTQLDFPTTLSKNDAELAKYRIFNHKLSPFPEYHFRIVLEKNWKAIDTSLETQINDGDLTFHTLGLFQKRDETNYPVAEIEVALAKIPTDKPSISLKDLAVDEYGSRLIEIVDYRTIGQTGQDILFTGKNDEGKTVAVRIMSYRDAQGPFFVVFGTAPIDLYNQYAQDFYAAMVSFEPN